MGKSVTSASPHFSADPTSRRSTDRQAGPRAPRAASRVALPPDRPQSNARSIDSRTRDLPGKCARGRSARTLPAHCLRKGGTRAARFAAPRRESENVEPERPSPRLHHDGLCAHRSSALQRRPLGGGQHLRGTERHHASRPGTSGRVGGPLPRRREPEHLERSRRARSGRARATQTNNGRTTGPT